MKFSLTAFTLSALALSASADIIVTNGWMNATAAGLYNYSPAAYDQRQNTPANGLNTSVQADYNGVHNATAYDFAITGSLGHILVDMDHSTEAIEDQYGEPHNQGFISFNVTNAPVDYYLSGAWTGNFQWTTYNVQLAAGKSTVFNNTQTTAIGGADFDLGAGGTLFGALTGTLGVGSYNLIYNITDQAGLGMAAASEGYVRIDFGAPPISAPAAVPEPATWASMGIGLAGLAFARRRRV